MQNSLIISGYSIRQDEEGRFCLNDLHKVSGNVKNINPQIGSEISKRLI